MSTLFNAVMCSVLMCMFLYGVGVQARYVNDRVEVASRQARLKSIVRHHYANESTLLEETGGYCGYE